jgi:mycothiol synthase
MQTTSQPIQPLFSRLRPFRQDDMEPLARLLWTAQACPPTVPPALSDIIIRWQRRNIDPRNDVQVLPDENGELVAFMQIGVFKDGTPRLNFEIAVRPNYRRQGIGTALYELVMQRAERTSIAQITTPVYTTPGETTGGIGAWLTELGFQPGHSFWQMRLNNIAQAVQPEWPDGVSVRTFSDGEHDPGIWAGLIMRCFGEVASAAGIIAQLSEPGVSCDGYFFAVDKATGHEIGTSRARIDVVGGDEIGYIGTVGVLPQYRGRGIAAALLGQTLAYLAGQGMSSATLFVENSNTNARNLYEKLGWSYAYLTNHYMKAIEHQR